MIRQTIVQILGQVPELGEKLARLASVHEDSLSYQVALEALAELAVSCLSAPNADPTAGLRCANAVELVAVQPSQEAWEAVAFCFLEKVGTEGLIWLAPALGPATMAILEHLADGIAYASTPYYRP